MLVPSHDFDSHIGHSLKVAYHTPGCHSAYRKLHIRTGIPFYVMNLKINPTILHASIVA